MNIVSLAESFGRLRAGQTVFVPGASGAPSSWMDALLRSQEASRGLAITTTYASGINRLSLEGLHPSARVTGLFMQPDLSRAQASGVFRHLPLSYAGFLRYLAEREPFDVAVAQVSPPDGAGHCSFGPSVEFAPMVLARAKRRVGVINSATPRVAGSVSIHADAFTELVESDSALPTYDVGGGDPVAAAIASHISPFIEDGMILQTGLGKVPGALLSALGDRRRLRFHSGMVSDGFRGLYDAGALAASQAHIACALVGSRSFYDWASEVPSLTICGCDMTHDPSVLASLDRFVAINSAIEVDLFGQCNLERIGGRIVSGAGGAPDFAAAAKRSRGGLSIMALPSIGGGRTRIRACLDAGTAVSVPRSDVDVVITEHGAADLRGKSVHERAECLVAIASPAMRVGLMAEWKGGRASF